MKKIMKWMNILLLFGALSSGVLVDNPASIFLNPIEVEAAAPITEDVIEIDSGIPDFTNEDFTNTEVYHENGPLDALGRVTEANAVVGVEIMPAEVREDIQRHQPTGWSQASYANIDAGGWLYNRSHLIGHQLTGNDEYDNLMTGTRWFNTRMLEYENFIADYVEETENHVRYRITPVFEGDNLVASGVYMEGYSIEDFGAGLMFNVFVPNVQPGVEINYADGTSKGPAGPPENGEIPEGVTTLQFLTKAQELPSVSEIFKMLKTQLAQTQDEIDKAYDSYGKLSKSAQEEASVVKWIGYVKAKETAVKETLSYNGEKFLAEARALPSVAAIKKMTPTQLVTLQTKIDTIQNSHNNLPGTIKKDSEVATWSGYVTAKENALNESLAKSGDAFVTEARKLPNVSAIEKMNASQLTSLNKRVQAARRTYNSLPSAVQKQRQVILWSGYLSEKETAVSKSFKSPSNQFINQVQNLPNVSTINQMNRTRFNQTKTAVNGARSNYNKLSKSNKNKADVIRWVGFLKSKEEAMGMGFLKEARALPNISAMQKMKTTALPALNTRLKNTRKTYNALSSVAKGDAEVKKWEGFLTLKEKEMAKLLPNKPEERGLIKGNISSTGERIYHVPGGLYYDRTDIDESAGERWFKTEVDAIKAGWRKSLR